MATKTYNVSLDESTDTAIVTPSDDPSYLSPVSRSTNITIAITVAKTPVGNLTAAIDESNLKVDAPKISAFLSALDILEGLTAGATPTVSLSNNTASYTKWEASSDGSTYTEVSFNADTKTVANLNGAVPTHYRFTITVNPLGSGATLLKAGWQHEIQLDESMDSDDWAIQGSTAQGGNSTS